MTISSIDIFWCFCVLQYALWETGLRHLVLDVVTYKPVKYLCVLGLSHYLSIPQKLGSFFLSVNPWGRVFIVIFLFRYVRLLVHIVAFWSYKPYPVPQHPSYRPEDSTVIVPTVQPYGEEFYECIRSVIHNGPAKILVVTAGVENFERALLITKLSPLIRVSMVNLPNKREQVSVVLPHVSCTVIG